MKRIVMKFGGTSVGTAEALRHTAQIIQQVKQHHEQVVVVISAMAGMTDGLIACIRSAEVGDAAACGQQIAQLQIHTADVIAALFADTDSIWIKSEIAQKFTELLRLCGQIQIDGQVSAKQYAKVVSFGERINVIILSALLRKNGLNSSSLEASTLIITDNRYYSASPICEVTHRCINKHLPPLLDEGVVPVVTGFIGATVNGDITTLGRGGSDYSAAIIARELGAEELWIWKDVDGILTTDPKVLPEAQLIQDISFNETYELAYYGAKVLHPKTLLTARDGGIPIRMMNTFNPQSGGTFISPRKNDEQFTSFKAVTGIEHVYLISVEGLGRIDKKTLSTVVADVLSQYDQEVLAAFEIAKDQSQHFALREKPSDDVIHQLKQSLNALVSGEPLPKVWGWNGRGIVSIIGEAASHQVNAINETLEHAGVDTGSYSCQHSSNSMQVLVPVHQIKKAIQSIHSEVILNAQ